MTDSINDHAVLILLVGLSVIASGLIEASFRHIKVPALVGYLLVGRLLSLFNSHWVIINEPIRDAFSFLADLGVIALLFKVGLESHPSALARKLPQAVPVWLGNVTGSALFGFGASFYILDLQLITSLIVATALTATSVGVSIATWQNCQAMDSSNGQLLLDVAELDDISAIALMALLFALIPILHHSYSEILSVLGITIVNFIAKFVLFIGLCYLFSRYLESRFSRFTTGFEPASQSMLTVLGVCFVIAAVADWLGFSLAIGALFAGLIFSHDPKTIKTERSFKDIYAFVIPFFFINIGLNVRPEYIVSGASLGLVLLIAAVVGKFIGAVIPSLITSGVIGASLIGVSLIPRAEIAMMIVHQGRQLGDWAMPEKIYAGMVFVSIMTCIGAPLILFRLLQRWPQTVKEINHD